MPRRLQNDPETLAEILCEHANEMGELLLLVVDQFEELLTLCLDVDEQQLYADVLVRAARHSYDPVRVIITLRDDFLVRVLVGWQREDAESVRLRDQLRATARQWVDRGRPNGLLWRGDALLEYRVWRGRYRGSLTDAEEEFARASAREDARGRRLRRTLSIAAFVILAAGFMVVLILNRQANSARASANVHAIQAEKHAAESRQRTLELYQEQGRRALLRGESMKAFAYLAKAHEEGADNTALHFMLSRVVDALRDQLLVLARASRGSAVLCAIQSRRFAHRYWCRRQNGQGVGCRQWDADFHPGGAQRCDLVSRVQPRWLQAGHRQLGWECQHMEYGRWQKTGLVATWQSSDLGRL